MFRAAQGWKKHGEHKHTNKKQQNANKTECMREMTRRYFLLPFILLRERQLLSAV